MCDAQEWLHHQPRRQRAMKIGPLGVVTAEERLDVREPGPVLDVEECPPIPIDGHEVCPAGELVVLVRLVQACVEAEGMQVGRLQLAHGRMHEVRGVSDAPSLRREEREAGLQAKRIGQAHIPIERCGLAGLDAVHHRGRDTRDSCQARLGPAEADSLGRYLSAKLDRDTADGGHDTGR